jgi:hypothetical protein
MVNNSTNINNHLSPKLTEHKKDQDIYVVVINQLMDYNRIEIHPIFLKTLTDFDGN